MGQPATIPGGDQAALLALLGSVADELYALVCEIVRLGESLSSGEFVGDRSQHICDLQSFDLLAQSALAQARLLKGIEQGLSEDAREATQNILLMIEDVPFHKIRQRLYSAYTGKDKQENAEMPWDGTGDLDWF